MIVLYRIIAAGALLLAAEPAVAQAANPLMPVVPGSPAGAAPAPPRASTARPGGVTAGQAGGTPAGQGGAGQGSAGQAGAPVVPLFGEQPPPPPPRSAAAAATSGVGPSGAPAVFDRPAAAGQAAQQTAGQQQDGSRYVGPAGLVQHLWEDGRRGVGQLQQGVKRYELVTDASGRASLRCVAGSGPPASAAGGAPRTRRATPPPELAYCPIRLRPGVATTVYLPAWEEYAVVLIGDDGNFQVTQRGAGAFTLSSQYEELDTNIEIVGKSGIRYMLWAVTLLNQDAGYLPDASVEILGDLPAEGSVAWGDRSSWMWKVAQRGLPEPDRVPARAARDRNAEPGLASAMPPLGGALGGGQGGSGAALSRSRQPDYLRQRDSMRIEDLAFDDYEVELASEESRSIRPKRVFHDGRTVYLDWGKGGGWFMPAIRRVLDGVSSNANTSPAGEGIVAVDMEVLGDLILVDGPRRVCIFYRPKTGESQRVAQAAGSEARPGVRPGSRP